jgi:hypothetical protein
MGILYYCSNTVVKQPGLTQPACALTLLGMSRTVLLQAFPLHTFLVGRGVSMQVTQPPP